MGYKVQVVMGDTFDTIIGTSEINEKAIEPLLIYIDHYGWSDFGITCGMKMRGESHTSTTVEFCAFIKKGGDVLDCEKILIEINDEEITLDDRDLIFEVVDDFLNDLIDSGCF